MKGAFCSRLQLPIHCANEHSTAAGVRYSPCGPVFASLFVTALLIFLMLLLLLLLLCFIAVYLRDIFTFTLTLVDEFIVRFKRLFCFKVLVAQITGLTIFMLINHMIYHKLLIFTFKITDITMDWTLSLVFCSKRYFRSFRLV